MKRFPSIKKNSEFQVIYKSGKSYANKLFVMYVFPANRSAGGNGIRQKPIHQNVEIKDSVEPGRGKPAARIGISVSRKVGNSVVRHRLLRKLREIFRLHKDRIEEGLDIVVVVRRAAMETDYKKLESAFLHLCGLHNILKELK